MSEIIKSMRIVKMYCWESAFEQRIRRARKWVWIESLLLTKVVLVRREIIECAFRLLLDCVQTLLSHTYSPIIFLMMYGAMWALNTPIDVCFFALAACMLEHMRLTIVDFFSDGIRNLVNYLAARKRIQVRRTFHLFHVTASISHGTGFSSTEWIWAWYQTAFVIDLTTIGERSRYWEQRRHGQHCLWQI